MSHKLVALDWDGTAAINGRIPESTLGTIEICRQNGDTFVTIATGRTYVSLIPELGNFVPNCPLVLENGGRVARMDGTVASSKPLELDKGQQEKLVDILGHAAMAAFLPLCMGEGYKIFHDIRDKDARRRTENLLSKHGGTLTADRKEFLSWLIKYGCVKMALSSPDKEITTQMLPSGLEVSSNEGLYDISATTKGFGVLELASMLDIPRGNIVVAGNDFNDISMFQIPAGTKIAVGRRCSELLELSTHQVESPNDLPETLSNILIRNTNGYT